MQHYEYEDAMRKTEAKAKELGLSHADYFTGTHRGISFKINRHNSYDFAGKGEMVWGHSSWCYYVFLRAENFSVEDWKKVYQTEPRIHDRSGGSKMVCRQSDWLDSCDFHGGVTLLTAECDPAVPDQILLQVGCDYNHLWDQEAGYPYDVEWVLRDVKNTIDKLHDTFELSIWSRIDGTYHREFDMEAYNVEASKRLDEKYGRTKTSDSDAA